AGPHPRRHGAPYPPDAVHLRRGPRRGADESRADPPVLEPRHPGLAVRVGGGASLPARARARARAADAAGVVHPGYSRLIEDIELLDCRHGGNLAARGSVKRRARGGSAVEAVDETARL